MQTHTTLVSKLASARFVFALTGAGLNAQEARESQGVNCRQEALVRWAIPSEMQRIRIEQHSAAGLLWFGAWLFTIGFLHLSFWKGVVAIVVWPYFLGLQVSPLH
jgi:hypothetical protein